MHGKVTRFAFAALVIALFAVLWVPWRIVQAEYGTRVDFDWNQATGFRSASLKRPPLPFVKRALITPFDEIVIIQGKSHINSELRKTGWKDARGTLGLSTVGPFPIVVGVDHLSLTSEFVIIDPEETPLMQAAGNGDTEQVSRLLVQGANPNAKDQSGYTALMYASKNSKDVAAVAAALLSAGAEVNAKDKQGNTALNWSVWNGIRLNVLKQLITSGADVNAKNSAGEPILLTAISSGGDEHIARSAAEVLVSAGADIHARDSNGETAISLAERIRRYSIVELLKERERKPDSTNSATPGK